MTLALTMTMLTLGCGGQFDANSVSNTKQGVTPTEKVHFTSFTTDANLVSWEVVAADVTVDYKNEKITLNVHGAQKSRRFDAAIRELYVLKSGITVIEAETDDRARDGSLTKIQLLDRRLALRMDRPSLTEVTLETLGSWIPTKTKSSFFGQGLYSTNQESLIAFVEDREIADAGYRVDLFGRGDKFTRARIYMNTFIGRVLLAENTLLRFPNDETSDPRPIVIFTDLIADGGFDVTLTSKDPSGFQHLLVTEESFLGTKSVFSGKFRAGKGS
jgi:hypothetical protein